MNLHRHLYPVAAIFTILTAASLGSSHVKSIAAATNPLAVFVTNSSANPVPVAPQGTTNVAVTNQPTVHLANDSGTPVPVRDVNVAGRIPVTFTAYVLMSQGSAEAAGDDTYTVPAGKRLVVLSTVASTFQFPTGQKLTQIGLSQKYGFVHTIPMQDQGEDYDGFEHFTGYYSGTMYFTAGAVLRAYANRSSETGDAEANIVVDGYLEDAS